MPSEPRFGRGLLGEDRFVDAPHGRRLRTMTAGGGDDLVVLEAGLGASGLYWGPVHRELAQHVRVVAYERAGYGASAPARGTPRDLPHLAADLARVIQAHPHRRLVLVGHSWGGPIVRTYAAEHRGGESTLAGMVLVDPSDEHAAELFTSRAARWSDAVQNALFVPLARARLLAPLMKTQLAVLPAEIQRAELAASTTVDAARAATEENRHVAAGLLHLRSAPPVQGDVALSVISGQQHGRLDQKLRARFVHAHRRTAQAHPAAQFVAAEHSGHMVPVTEPEVIAEQALRLFPARSSHR